MIRDLIRPKVIDLYAGVGGLSLGAARAGFDVALAIERDARIAQAHVKNFPSSKHAIADIGQLSGADVLRLAGLRPGEVDGIIGGPPCQGFSSIGKKQASDKRNNLFIKFFELVREIRPRFFLAENVPGILLDTYAELRETALANVTDYEIVGPLTVRASDYGAPTSRTRVVYLGFLREVAPAFTPSDFMPVAEQGRILVGEALRGLPRKIKDSWLTDESAWRKVRTVSGGDFWDRVSGFVPPGVGDEATLRRLADERRVSGCIATKHSAVLHGRYGRLKSGQRDPATRSVRLSLSGFCPTLRAGTGSDHGSFQAVRPIHPQEPRVITPREAARLQGFPDWFRFDETKWHAFRQIGNSVSPLVAESILHPIAQRMKAMKETRAA